MNPSPILSTPYFLQELPSGKHADSSKTMPKPETCFKQALEDHFPSSLLMNDYVRTSLQLLKPLGFCKANTLACVSVCRDEMTKPLVTTIQRMWNNVFSFSGLAGMLFMGKTGFRAAHHHAPHLEGKRRQVFFAFPHIGLGPFGELGLCLRREDQTHSPACGALIALQQEMAEGRPVTFDPYDPEQSLIRQRLSGLEGNGHIPDLLTLTKKTYGLIVQDLESMISTMIDPGDTHYAVLSGIQVHGSNHKCYIWPGASYAVVAGERHNLSFVHARIKEKPTHHHGVLLS